jgi:hypothetical protein
MKKFTMVAVALITACASLSAQAKVWSTVEVTLAGAEDSGGIFLKLNNAGGGSPFNDRMFRMAQPIEDIGLAIGLASVSSNRKVVIYSDFDEVDNLTHPTIHSIYLYKAVVGN